MTVLTVSRDDDGVRVDRILRKALAKVSLSAIYRFMRKGNIRVCGKRIKQGYRVKEGDVIEIMIPDSDIIPDNKETRNKVQSLVHTDFFRQNFNIIYEDETLLVCNKPAGIVVHSGTGHVKNDNLIDCAMSYVMHNSKKGKYIEPILVHRLDRDTSGVILIAKNKQILRSLHHSFRNHELTKKYKALCHGIPSDKKGAINLSLVKTHERNSGMKVKVHKGGIQSLSRYRVVTARKGISQLEIDLHTGRTHQIRVHLAYISCPVIGDVRYGNNERDTVLFKNKNIPHRLYLHAEQISFYHPDLGRQVTFTAILPETFQKALKSLI